MISFYINGESVEVQLEGEKTIGDVLKSFEMTCEENAAAVIGITVDDKVITADTFDEEASKPLGKDTKFNFSVVTKDSIKKVADSIDNFCHIAALASLFPQDFGAVKIDGKQFSEFFADFSPILSDFEQALTNNDTVLIGDLSEYEICPRLKAISQALNAM